MSDDLYPVSLLMAPIDSIVVTPFDRTISDTFESGASAARGLWPARYFKRKIEINYSALSASEYRLLRSFYHLHGTSESFWWRGNAQHQGNIKVRFVEALKNAKGPVYEVGTVKLEEVAPVRVLLEQEEVAIQPSHWYEASREVYPDLSTPTNGYDEMGLAPLIWPTVPFSLKSTDVLSNCGQRNAYAFNGSTYGVSAANVSGMENSNAQPGATTFLICQIATGAVTEQMLLGMGTEGGTGGLGLVLNAAGNFQPWRGTAADSAAYGANTILNTGAWCSLAVKWQRNSNLTTMLMNGSGPTPNSVSRSWPSTGGKVFLGGTPSGALLANAGNVLANCNIGVAMVFGQELTTAQIKAVHNQFVPFFPIASLP